MIIMLGLIAFVVISLNNVLLTDYQYIINVIIVLLFISYKTKTYETIRLMICNEEDARPLLFFRYSFGFLMMVYSANKITDDSVMIKTNQFVLGYSYRIPSYVDDIIKTFPWFTTNLLYWKAHSSFLLLSATGIAYGSGFISCFSCYIFALLKLVLTLQDQSHFNNHEYLYSLLALALGLVDCHQTLQTSSNGLIISTFGVIYLMIQNSLYGIAGSIAIVGCSLIWIGIILHIHNNKRKIILLRKWNASVIRLIIISIYTFAGIAKTDIDWYSGMTVRSLLNERGNWIVPTASYLLNLFDIRYQQFYDQIIVGMAYGGMMLDLLSPLGFLTSNNYIRYTYLMSVLVFHITNHYLFILETFPWVMISSCTIFYGYSWFDSFGNVITKIVNGISYVFLKFAFFWNVIRLVVLLLLILIVIVIPFPCAWNTILGNGDLQWGSQCQFFNWRMMTRSVKVASFYMRIHNPVNGNVDIKSIHEMGYDANDDNGLECIAFYEDRLWDWVKSIKIPVENQKYISPMIYADIFLEVNGPPIQRYVDPNINLSQQYISKFSVPCTSFNGCISWLFKKPDPLASWVVPRIAKYRTLSWIDRIKNIEKSELSRMISNSNYTISKPEVIFVADTEQSGMLSLVLEEYSLIEILDGAVEITHIGRLTKGNCLFAKGVMSMKTLNFENDNQSLFMVSLPKGKASFGIVSYTEALVKPLLSPSFETNRNCTFITYKE